MIKISVTLFIFQIGIVVFAQFDWVRSSNNLVMLKDTNIYEGLGIGSPSIIMENDTLKMLYAAGGTDQKGRISYAYSIDGGETWIKHNNATPVFWEANSGYWDSHFLDTPEWIKDDAGYKLYYFGDTDNNPIDGAIGVAVSSNGLNWSRIQNQPVITPGSQGEWDELYIESPTVLFYDSQYYMWFSGVDSNYTVRIGMATSTDGINWQKYQGNPVVNVGDIISWDGYGVATPTVVRYNNKFYMWYCGASYFDIMDNNAIDTIKVGLATSIDGYNWTKYPANPVMSTFDSLFSNNELRGPWAPDVIYDSIANEFRMLYETAYGFGLAYSNNNINGLVQLNQSKDLVIYPNPVHNNLHIDFLKRIANDILYIKNLSGMVVKQKAIINAQNIDMDIGDLANGIYIITLKHRLSYYRIIKM